MGIRGGDKSEEVPPTDDSSFKDSKAVGEKMVAVEYRRVVEVEDLQAETHWRVTVIYLLI